MLWFIVLFNSFKPQGSAINSVKVCSVHVCFVCVVCFSLCSVIAVYYIAQTLMVEIFGGFGGL